MLNIENQNINCVLSQLPETTRNLSQLLLSVDWNNVNLDFVDIKSSLNTNNSCFSIKQIELINAILTNIPEWERLINCKQHPTHDYDLGIHTLLVIQKIQNDKNYDQLNLYEKLIILYTALLHDIEKIEKIVDPEHPLKGAQTASLILQRLGFDKDFFSDICVLIQNHQVLGLMAASRLHLKNHELAEMLKKTYLINLLAILALADIKSVKKNEAFFTEKIGKNIQSIRENTINYFDKTVNNQFIN